MDVVQLLLDANASVKERNCEGWTALMWAARANRPRTVAQLLAAGASSTVHYTIATGTTGLQPGAGEIGGVTALSIARAGYEAARRLHERTPKKEVELWEKLRCRMEARQEVLRLLSQQRRFDPRLEHAVREGNLLGCRSLLALPPQGAAADPAALVPLTGTAGQEAEKQQRPETAAAAAAGVAVVAKEPLLHMARLSVPIKQTER